MKFKKVTKHVIFSTNKMISSLKTFNLQLINFIKIFKNNNRKKKDFLARLKLLKLQI